MLSKKYYKILADLLGKAENLEDFQNKLVAFLASDNIRFSPEKFRAAIENTFSNMMLEKQQQEFEEEQRQ
jgi:hypothetical protein